MKRILVATDLSSRSGHALHRALSLADQFGASLDVVTVVEEMFFEKVTRQNAELAEAALRSQVEALPRDGNASVSFHVDVGADFERILKRADDRDVDLIVLGPHRHPTPEMFRGTTSERVIRHGTRPVLVARSTVEGPYRRAIVASDLSAQAGAAAGLAARMVPGGDVWLLHAVQRSFTGFLDKDSQDAVLAQDRARARAGLEETARRLAADLGDDVPSIEIDLPEGPVREAVRERTTHLGADLLAMGTHGRSGIARAIIGSIALEFLATGTVDVLVAKA